MVSVVMPTYDGDRFVGAALDSIVDQGPCELEVVVVDDGSRDGTRDIVKGYEDRLDLRIVDGPGRGNWVAATNAGLRAARHDRVTMLHQDDVWLAGRAARLAAGPATGLHLTGARFLSPAGVDVGPWSLPFPIHDVGSDEVVAHLLVQNSVCIAAPVFDRVQALDTGGLDEDLWYTADWDLWLRLAALGPVSHTPEATVGFRVHGASQTATRTADLAGMRAQLATVRDRHWRSWAAARPPREASRVRRASDAAMDVNVALAGAASGQLAAMPAALRSVLLLGPAWSRFWRSSRLRERVGARLRARR